MESPMTCRSHRVVSALLVLAATASVQAADEIELRSSRFSLHATVAGGELMVEQKAPVRAGARQARVQLAGQDRAATQSAARTLLAAGTASRVDPVVYLNGRVGEADSRAIATRRILLEAAPGHNPATIASEHGLRLTEAVQGRAGWWIAEPLDPGVFAALDAARSLAADARASLVWPLLEMPVTTRFAPNDAIYAAGYQWHLTDALPGIRIAEVWDTYTGEGTNLAISDTGVQTTHPDLALNVRVPFMRDYFNNDADPNPYTTADNHGTAVAGLAAAIGHNNTGIAQLGGVTGVAFKSGIIVSKVLHDYDPNAIGATSLAPDDRLRAALTVQNTSSSSLDLCWANNNSWGIPDTGAVIGGPGPLVQLGLYEATTWGRNRFGVPIIFACGNGGNVNPNAVQDCTAFDGYLNRYVIGVAALTHPTEALILTGGASRTYKARYSESGPNITISAPGGGASPGYGMVTTDRTGVDGYVTGSPATADSDFDGDGKVWLTLPPNTDWPYENGDYIPASRGLAGTTLAAPLVTGVATLMEQARPTLSWRDVRQIMMHRGQDVLPYRGPAAGLHGGWSQWRPNFVNLNYNNWYGFGAIDTGRFIFGGTGADANKLTTAARDEPGALRWPLLPPLLLNPLSYSATFPVPTGGAVDNYAIYDAPTYDPDPTLVPPGRPIVGLGDRTRNVIMPITTMPDRFRVDSVELTVVLRDLGPDSYPGPTTPVGVAGGFSWGQYVFSLTSPNGTTCILGRQRPGATIGDGQAFTWTFTELFHTNETDVAGNWTLSIVDEVDNIPPDFLHDPANGNPPESRVESVTLNLYGHQTYAQPTLAGTSVLGVASGEGDQALELNGSGFATSQGGLSVTQPYWDLDGLAGAGVPTEMGSAVLTDSRMSAIIPASLLPTISPGQGYLTVANPAVVVGRTNATPTAVDAFDTPNVPIPTASPAGTDRYMKRCPDTNEKLIKYSRRPTLTPISDLSLTTGGAFNVSTVAFDPDVAAGLPIAPATPESLTLTIVSYNQSFVPLNQISVTGPVGLTVTHLSGPERLVISSPPGPGSGNGTYVINASAVGSTGWAMLQVSASDGVLTTTRSFRVVVPTDETGNGCGGGMGLALLGVPLAAWFIRRRRDRRHA